MTKDGTKPLSIGTLKAIASSVEAYSEDLWQMTRATEMRLQGFARQMDGPIREEHLVPLSEEAIRISAIARRDLEAGRIDPVAAEYANTASLLDPRGYERAQGAGKIGNAFSYDRDKVEIDARDAAIIAAPRPIIGTKGPAPLEPAPMPRGTGVER